MSQQPNEQRVETAVELAKVIGSPTRFKILYVLMQHSDTEICVKELADAVGMSHSATSHQLAKLEDKGVVSCCRNGQTMCYQLNDTPLANNVKYIVKKLS